MKAKPNTRTRIVRKTGRTVKVPQNAKADLVRSYVSVRNGDQPSYGGDQNWFSGDLQRCGCGIIGAADILWYLRNDDEVTLDEYHAYVKKIRRNFVMIPHKGMPGFLMAICFDIYMRRKKLPYRVTWGTLPGRIRETATAMLEEDIPVPFCVGPCLHQAFQKPAYRGLKLYEKREEAGGQNGEQSGGKTGEQSSGQNGDQKYVWTKTVRSHFMVMTGVDGKWARISSWGHEYYIDLEELEDLARKDVLGQFTNIIRIRRLKRYLDLKERS